MGPRRRESAEDGETRREKVLGKIQEKNQAIEKAKAELQGIADELNADLGNTPLLITGMTLSVEGYTAVPGASTENRKVRQQGFYRTPFSDVPTNRIKFWVTAIDRNSGMMIPDGSMWSIGWEAEVTDENFTGTYVGVIKELHWREAPDPLLQAEGYPEAQNE